MRTSVLLAVVILLVVLILGGAYYRRNKALPLSLVTPSQRCNRWKDVPPDTNSWGELQWASTPPGCTSVDVGCNGWLPAGATTLDDQHLLGGLTFDPTGLKFETNLISLSPPQLKEFQLIVRDPRCGIWRTTTDPAKAFHYHEVPVCYPLADDGWYASLRAYNYSTGGCPANYALLAAT